MRKFWVKDDVNHLSELDLCLIVCLLNYFSLKDLSFSITVNDSS